MLLVLAILGVGLVFSLGVLVRVVRDYERTLATATHAGWMRTIGPDGTQLSLQDFGVARAELLVESIRGCTSDQRSP